MYTSCYLAAYTHMDLVYLVYTSSVLNLLLAHIYFIYIEYTPSSDEYNFWLSSIYFKMQK